jgi:Mg-chelatase subunit ChlD
MNWFLAGLPPAGPVRAGLATVLLLGSISACEINVPARRSATARPADDRAPYQADVEEGLAAVAILVDTSGSMRELAPGATRPKHIVARESLEAMLDATDAFVARRPDFPIKIGIYTFASSVSRTLPIQVYNRDIVRAALKQLPAPGGGTAIGEAMRDARPDLYRAGVFRKYLLVVTDGENTNGRDPEDVARTIFQKSEGAVQIYFVAFDTSAEKFGFLKEVGGRRDRRRERPGTAHGARRDLPGPHSRRGHRRRRARAREEVTRRDLKESPVIVQKFWSAFVAQLNKIANVFWEADPIAQMRYEYDQSVEQLKEGRTGLEQYRGLVERVPRQVAANRSHVQKLEAETKGARVTSRRRELAVRAAPAASRGRVVRFLLVESAMLALGVAVVGVAVASVVIDVLRPSASITSAPA